LGRRYTSTTRCVSHMSLFALVDCNNFYVSCERAFNPLLEKFPVVVLSNNDGCIIARSNEAKKIGIPMGAPFFKWEKVCKRHNIKVFSSNYELYGDMSQRVMHLLKEKCAKTEIYSIDEAFLSLAQSTTQDLTTYASNLRHTIRSHLGLPVSIGIGTTKTLAKIANYLAKKDTHLGVYQLDPTHASIFNQIPVEKIWGIGHRMALKLKLLNIHTAQQLRDADSAWLRLKFGVTLEKLIYELRGTTCLSLESIQPRKQIISSRSFGKLLTRLEDIEEAISHYTATACSKLRKQNSLASAMTVFLHTNFFSQKDPQYENSTFFPFPTPSADTGYMIRIAKKCIKHLYKKEYRYHKAGLILLDILPNSTQQRDWLTPHTPKKDQLMKAVDIINLNFGKDTIFHGAEGIKRSWQLKSECCSPRYTTRWEELPTVI
jgi:DNA polymerase V